MSDPKAVALAIAWACSHNGVWKAAQSQQSGCTTRRGAVVTSLAVVLMVRDPHAAQHPASRGVHDGLSRPGASIPQEVCPSDHPREASRLCSEVRGAGRGWGQDEHQGGISDRPEDMCDVFHTFFGIAALSLMGHRGLVPIDPMFALPVETVERLRARRRSSQEAQGAAVSVAAS